ncbi:MAG: GAF domain-containing protein, partial [Gaiellaceae bacterium]
MAAVGYLMLALAGALLVAAVVWLFLSRRKEETPELADEPPEPEAAPSLSVGFAPAQDATSVARGLLDEVVAVLEVEFAAVMLISDNRKEATGLVARMDGEDADWFRSVRIDLEHEPSAVASAVFEAAPLTIFEVESSPRVSRRLADRVGAKSAAFVPVVSGARVLAVLVVASTSRRRNFPPQEIARLEALAGETALAMEKTRSAAQLEEALGRERLVAEIARRVRSEHDVEAVLRIAVEEVGKATDVSRCFVRLGEPGAPTPIRAEWAIPSAPPIGDAAPNLAVSNLAMRERRTIAVADVELEPKLEDPSLGGVDTLLRLRTRAALATPIHVFDRTIGVFALHCSEPTEWTQSQGQLVEAVAREVGLALHTAELLEENRLRLARQAALVQAAQVMTSELQVETVLERLVVEVTKLLEAEAADCYLLDSRRGVLRCAAVYGLPGELVEFEFPAEGALAGEAMRRRQAVLSGDYEDVEPPHPAYEGFTAAMVAPMTWWGEVRGVIGVATTDPERRFSQEDIELLEAFASLGSVALRNLASIEQSSRQVRIQRGFFRIASVLAQPLSLDETLDAVAQAASEALGGSFAAVLMPGDGGLRLAGSHELPPAVAQLFREGIGGAEPLEDAAARKQVLASPQLAEDDRFGDEWRALAEAEGSRSLVAVPVEAPRREQTGIGLVFFS